MATGIQSRDVEIQAAGGGQFQAYLAMPDQPTGDVLVVLQEIYGVNSYLRGVADSYAAQGLIAIAPDLFWRQQPGIQLNPDDEADAQRAIDLVSKTDVNQAVEDARAAVDYAASLPQATGKKAAVGFCFGGRIGFLLAARGGVDRIVSYYGTYLHYCLGETAAIKGEVLLHTAAEDNLCPPDMQAKIADAITVLGDRAKMITYPGAGHAFARVGFSSYVAEAAEKANAESARFLREGSTQGA